MLSELKNIDLHQKYLLAVSGGIDSMVMAHLFANSEYKCAIAHCNFRLRGAESDDDEQFVRNFADSNGRPFFSIRFDTEKYAAANGLSIQLAARELRYRWFEQIRAANGFDKIALAHNADDSIETFFINLLRGAGLNGLTGISAQTDVLVRPLIDFSRKDIEAYAAANQLLFREDSSNASHKYLRNKIRHLALPLLDETSPAFRKQAAKTMTRLTEANEFLKTEIAQFLDANSFWKNGDLYISLASLRKAHSPKIRLFYILEPYGFKGDMLVNIHNSIEDAVSGKQFFSPSHLLLTDREYLIVSPLAETPSAFTVNENTGIACKYFDLNCETLVRDSSFCLKYNSFIGEFDHAKLKFPLVVRNVEHGDRFVPLGMNGTKKLSDFLINLKLPQTEKRRQQVVVSNNDIIWVVGLRPDNRFKVTEATKKIFRIYFTNHLI
ncbi:MAG: tRNA lysidine(34) synthetase TilS [Prevotellaceae bacterium]|jgi:tRNA(Ile)-lysidine synthase|nr:tRNA lysidine(34) synthetase TilS [Prevotellaceae bacterium]